MEEGFIVRAVDTGRRNTKYTLGMDGEGNPRCAMFPSLAIPNDKETAFDSWEKRPKTVDVPLEGLFYTVGPEVRLIGGRYEAQVLQHERYCETPEYLALTLGALHYMNVERIDLLVVGLPVKTMRNKKVVKALEKRLTGIHQLGKKRMVEVRTVRALEQPAGALMRYGRDQGLLREMSAQRNLVIDPGFHTFDWVVSEGMKVIKGRSDSVPLGMFNVLHSIAQGVSTNMNVEFRDYEALDAALRKSLDKPTVDVFQQTYPLGRHLPLARKVADQAVGEMLAHIGTSSDIRNIILVGGAEFFYRKAISAAFPRHKIGEVKHPVTANVEGFHLAGVEYAKSLAATTKAEAPQDG